MDFEDKERRAEKEFFQRIYDESVRDAIKVYQKSPSWKDDIRGRYKSLFAEEGCEKLSLRDAYEKYLKRELVIFMRYVGNLSDEVVVKNGLSPEYLVKRIEGVSDAISHSLAEGIERPHLAKYGTPIRDKFIKEISKNPMLLNGLAERLDEISSSSDESRVVMVKKSKSVIDMYASSIFDI